MKQMSLIEMDGFLKGKCIPRDLMVNETNAEYLVRKFAEAEAKISALSEDHQKAIESIKQADAAVKLAHEKFSAMAAENVRLKSAVTQQIELRAEIKRQAGHLTLTSGFSQFAKLRKRLSERLKKPQPPMLSWLKYGRRG